MTFQPSLSKVLTTGKAMVTYYSVTGNTRKVALAIQRGVRKGGLLGDIRNRPNAEDVVKSLSLTE